MENIAENSDILKYEKKTSERPSILLIDDDIDILDVYKIVLKQGGFDIFTARSGAEAIETLFQINQPDLIFLDMQLGDMSGTELLTLLEQKQPDIIGKVPVVFLTGMEMGPLDNAVGVIIKPVGLEELVAAAHHFIKKEVVIS